MGYEQPSSSLHGQPVEEESYLFGKPAWRIGLPLFLLFLIWIPAAFLWKGVNWLPAVPQGEPADMAGAILQIVHVLLDSLESYGVTLKVVTLGSVLLSIPVVLLLFTGLERLVVTPSTIVRGFPLLPKQRIFWSDLDEVQIDHAEVRFEDETTAKRTLTLYTRRGRLLPIRRRMRVTNRQFDGYEEVERIAVAVGVPAIADRLRQIIESSGKPVRFPIVTLRRRFLAGLSVLASLGLMLLSLWSPFWNRLQPAATQISESVQSSVQAGLLGSLGLPNLPALPMHDILRLVTAGAGLALFFFGVSRLIYHQVAVDMGNIYILRRNKVRRTIPLDSLADIQILGNRMTIYAYRKEGDDDPRLVWKTRHFVPNRGVLLCLLRDLYDRRRMLDLTPIVPMRSLPSPEQQTV